MNIVIVHKSNSSYEPTGCFHYAMAGDNPLIAQCLVRSGSFHHSAAHPQHHILMVWPDDMSVNVTPDQCPPVLRCRDSVRLDNHVLNECLSNKWMVLSHARYIARIDQEWFERILSEMTADVVTIQIEPDLTAFRENLRLTSQGNVVGVRRLYGDAVRQASQPGDWPHLIYIRSDRLTTILRNQEIPLSFMELLSQCSHKRMAVQHLRIAGDVLDLEKEDELLFALGYWLEKTPSRRLDIEADFFQNNGASSLANAKYPACRLYGSILMGRNVEIGQNAIIIGPAIIADNVKVAPGGVIRNCIIGKDHTIPERACLEHRILLNGTQMYKPSSRQDEFRRLIHIRRFWDGRQDKQHYRLWPCLSYPHCLKRILDIGFSMIVLFVFAPIFPIVMAAIKINSPGPIFFKDRRQGRWGKEFFCLKFRSMKAHAEKGQERLRIVNQVDGPQFKLSHDPRITAVGRFLRDTCIDEIPQFVNVFLGQMSVVGPRPSPVSENSLCPYWRDARLSVRPGITGLWQVCRTRSEQQDFQEWIHYDTRYVRDVSFKLDIWICYQTMIKLLKDFVKQF